MNPDYSDDLSTLSMAARDDPEFRQRLAALLRLPKAHREPLLRTAVDEMALRGESAEIRTAFLLLADDEVARRAFALLQPTQAGPN